MFKHAGMRTLAAQDFVSAKPPAVLSDDEIHIWFFPNANTATGKIDFTTRLRNLLGAYLHIDPAALRIERGPHGKPYLAALPGRSILQFNLSHSGAALLVGLSRTQALGVDLETLGRTRAWLDLAQRYFSPIEYHALSALSPTRLPNAFLDIWSCKEAVLKALGRGLAFGLDRLGFALDAEGAVTRLAQIDAAAGAVEAWNIVRLMPAEGLLGALAWRGPKLSIRAFHADF